MMIAGVMVLPSPQTYLINLDECVSKLDNEVAASLHPL